MMIICDSPIALINRVRKVKHRQLRITNHPSAATHVWIMLLAMVDYHATTLFDMT